MAAPGFKMAGASFKWAVSGFGNSTVWLIFGAFMFAAGYDKRSSAAAALILVKYLGRRSLTLGYAITFADLLLAPFTPSNTARSGGLSTRLSLTCRRCTVQSQTIRAHVKSVPI